MYCVELVDAYCISKESLILDTSDSEVALGFIAGKSVYCYLPRLVAKDISLKAANDIASSTQKYIYPFFFIGVYPSYS